MPKPSEGFTDQDRQVIKAPLSLGNLYWTSGDIANSLGISQSRVARTWQRLYMRHSSTLLLPEQIIISEVKISSQNTYVLCHLQEGTKNRKYPGSTPVMRSPRRFSLQSLLAAQELAKDNQKHGSRFDAFESLESNPNQMIVLTTDSSFNMSGIRKVALNEENWQGLLSYLVQASYSTPASELRTLQQDLILWSLTPERNFDWKGGQTPSTLKNKLSNSGSIKSTQQVIADQIFETIVNRIWNGLLTAGDRITEASLARELRTTRNQTRDAIRNLISSGLIDHDSYRGAIVPSPSSKDVVDIYAARKALGIEILKRAIAKKDFQIELVYKALTELETVAKTGDSYEAGNADLRFQDVIAANSGMRNIPQMFSTLAKQLQIYIAVMGITYVYSIEDMVKDDRKIFNHLRDKELDLAIKAWQEKVDDSLAFMTNYVAKHQTHIGENP